MQAQRSNATEQVVETIINTLVAMLRIPIPIQQQCILQTESEWERQTQHFNSQLHSCQLIQKIVRSSFDDSEQKSQLIPNPFDYTRVDIETSFFKLKRKANVGGMATIYQRDKMKRKDNKSWAILYDKRISIDSPKYANLGISVSFTESEC